MIRQVTCNNIKTAPIISKILLIVINNRIDGIAERIIICSNIVLIVIDPKSDSNCKMRDKASNGPMYVITPCWSSADPSKTIVNWSALNIHKFSIIFMSKAFEWRGCGDRPEQKLIASITITIDTDCGSTTCGM